MCQVYLGADGAVEEEEGWGRWRKKFRVLELVLHYKHDKRKTRQGRKTTYRTDYDIALLRIDYPVVDERNGKLFQLTRS